MPFFSDTALRLAEWWAENRRKLREARMVLFLAAVFVLLVVDAVQIALLAGTDATTSAQLSERSDRIAAVAVADTPKDPTVVSTAAVPVGPGVYDLAARLANPNTGWLAEEVRVHFRTALGEAPGQTTFLAPATETGPLERLLILPQVAAPSAAAPELVVDSVRWRRVSARDIEVLGGAPVTVTAATLVPTTLQNGSPATRAEIELRNPSVYGYRQIEIAIAVERAGTVLAVRRTTAENLRSGASTTVVAVWEQRFADGATLRVDPAVNPFDPSVRLTN